MKEEITQIFLGATIAFPIAFLLGSIGHIAYGDDTPSYIDVFAVVTGICIYLVSYLLAGKLLKK